MTDIRKGLHHVAITMVVVFLGSGACGREVSSTISVSAIVLPTYGRSLSDATITVTSCGQVCAERGADPGPSVRAESGARPLSAVEKTRLDRDGIDGLATVLRATAGSGLTIVSFDF